MRKLITLVLVAVSFTAFGQVVDSSTFLSVGGAYDRSYENDTVVVTSIANTEGGAGYRMVSGTDTSYIFAFGDTLIIAGDTIRFEGFVDFPAPISIDSITSNYINYPVTQRQPTSAGVTNTGTIYRDTSNVVAVDRCLPWTCNDSLDVILTDTTANVGIGTTSPSAALHVVGSINVYHDSIDDFVTSELISGSDLYLNESGEYNSGMVIKGTDIAQTNIKGYGGVTFNEDVEALEASLVVIDTTEGLGAEEYIYVRKDKVNLKSSDGVDISTIDITPNEIAISTTGGMLISDGTEADGYVLTSDATGNATWQDPNCITGWESIYDATSTWSIGAGDTQTILINREVVLNSQLPCGIDSLYNVTDSTIIGLEGDAYDISLDWTITQNSPSATEFKYWINIGGAVGAIYPTTYQVDKGNGNSQAYNKTTTVYTLDTWEANGGKIQFVSDNDITVSDVRINIFRIHKAR